jgi:MscS family membrane protein
MALLLAELAGARPVYAQAKPVVATAMASAEKKEAEEEAPDSPRVSMRHFFELSEKSRYQEAAAYLDLPRGSEKRGPDFAAQLHEILSERLLVDPETLSPLAHGDSRDGMATTEELGKISDSNGHPIAIRLVRHESRAPDDEARWVFSQTTVSSIPTLYNSLRAKWIRERLPAALRVQGPMALYYWQWLALPTLAGICFAIGRLLSLLSGLVVRRFSREHRWAERLLRGMKSPTTLGWALLLFTLATPFLALTLRADDLLDRGVRALAYLTFFWALLRAVTVFGDEVAHAEWARSRPSARSLSAVGVSLGRVVVAALALMVALTELGYPVTSVIAGLGIGGVALALAAQKTVENLFGSLSILADQPFRVGDTIRVDTIEGSVESIGIRSTRVRTADRTLVIFPNGKLADMRIESLGPRDRMRLSTKLPLARTVSTSLVRRITADIRAVLAAQPLVRKEDVLVRLVGIGESSYDIEVTTTLQTLDWNEFARVREELLIAFVDIVEKAGAKLAVPARELVNRPQP